MKRSQHPLGLAAPAGGRSDDGVRRGDGAEFFDERLEVQRVGGHHLDRGQMALKSEEFLCPADIHRGQTGLGGHSDIVGFQFKYWTKCLRGAAR